MPKKKLTCPVCGKEYVSKYHFDKHVESHGEHEVTWDEGEAVIEEIEPVLIPTFVEIKAEPEPEEVDATREATPAEL